MSRQIHWTKAAMITVSAAILSVAAAVPANADDGTTTPTTVRQLVLDGTISRAEWRAVKQTARTAHEDAHDEARATALQDLVTAGRITAAEADHIATSPRRRGLHDLARAGGVSHEDAVDIRAALRGMVRPDRVAVLHDAMSSLVAAGVLTQQQADAVEEAAGDGRLGTGLGRASGG
jgi:hypothetical protein